MCRYLHILWNNKKNLWLVYYWNNSKKNIATQSFNNSKYFTKENALIEAKKFASLFPKEHIIEMSVNEYMKLSEESKSNLACFKVGITKWPYESKNILIDPWLLGAWLGDQNSDGKGFTNIECINEIIKYLEEIDCRIEKSDNVNYRLHVIDTIAHLLSQLGFVYSITESKFIH